MSKMIKLSIVIPVYNSEKYLGECINSVLSYGGSDIEIILVDDGSTDESGALCRRYELLDDRLTYIRKKNGGASSARNLGIKNAKGKYVMFVDSDDVLDEKWPEIFNYLNQDDVIIFSKKICSNATKEDIIKNVIGGIGTSPCLAGPVSKAFKRSLLIKNKIVFNEQIINGEDMIFNVSVLSCAKRIKIVNIDFYNYRRNYSSITNTYNDSFIFSDIEFHRELKRLLGGDDRYNEIRTYSMQKALIVIMKRLALVGGYHNIQKEITLLKSNYYKKALMKKCLLRGKMKLVFMLLRHGQYRIAYLLVKARLLWKNGNRGEGFVRL